MDRKGGMEKSGAEQMPGFQGGDKMFWQDYAGLRGTTQDHLPGNPRMDTDF